MLANTLRRAAAIVACLGLASLGAAAQQPAVKLFKIITAKDEVVIGLTEPGAEVDNVARRLVSDGQVTAWQYAVKRAADGSLVQAPLRRVAVLKADTLRVEPFNPAPLKVVPPE